MSLSDRIIQLATLILLLLCLITTCIYSMRVRNLENEVRAEMAALRLANRESVEQCKRISYTCIDIMNSNLWEGEQNDRN